MNNPKLDQIRASINVALAFHQAPIVACSFGKDSMLLLHLVREQRPNIPVLWLKQDLLASQRKFVESVIRDWNLTVYSVLPVDHYFIASGDGPLSLVREYDVNGRRFPLIQDLVHSDRCSLRLKNQKAPASIELPFDVVFAGSKRSDHHPLTGALGDIEKKGLGGMQISTPLSDLTDDDVWAATRELGLPVNESKYAGDDQADPDCVVACSRCMSGEGRVWCPDIGAEIDAVVWDREAARESFLQRFF